MLQQNPKAVTITYPLRVRIIAGTCSSRVHILAGTCLSRVCILAGTYPSQLRIIDPSTSNYICASFYCPLKLNLHSNHFIVLRFVKSHNTTAKHETGIHWSPDHFCFFRKTVVTSLSIWSCESNTSYISPLTSLIFFEPYKDLVIMSERLSLVGMCVIKHSPIATTSLKAW